MPLRLIVPIIIFVFTGIVIVGAIVFLVMEALDRVESINQRFPSLAGLIQRRKSFNVLFVLCIVMLIGVGYEFVIKEIPPIPSPPITRPPSVPVFPPPLDSSKDQEIARLRGLLDQSERNKRARAAIAPYMNEGITIMREAHDTNERPDLEKRANQWAIDCTNSLSTIDPSYPPRFNSAEGMTINLVGVPALNRRVWNFVHYKNEELEKILTELR